MTASIHGPGNQPITSGSSAIVENGEVGKAAVSGGFLDNDIKLQMLHSDKAAASSPLESLPLLVEPRIAGLQAQAFAHQAASKDLAELDKVMKQASEEVGSSMVRVQLGMQTPQDQELLQRNAKSLDGAASYVDSMTKDGGDLTNDEKAFILGGQGFSNQQISGLLLSQSDPTAFKEQVSSKHDSNYSKGASDLKALGYSDSQANILLSLGDDNIINSDSRKDQLNKVFENNPEAQKLVSLGFNENKVRELLNTKGEGQDRVGISGGGELTQLLGRAGFSENDAKAVIAGGNTKKLEEQNVFLKTTSSPDVSNKLRSLAEHSKLISNSPVKPFLEESLKQQADIFMVLELIHKMSVEGRRSAREQRSIEYDAAKTEVLFQAEKIKDAALFTLAADLATGTASMAGGIASLRAGAKGGVGKGKGKGKSSSSKGGDNDVEVSKGKSKSSSSKGGDNDVDVSKGKSKSKSKGDSEDDTSTSSRKRKKRSSDGDDSQPTSRSETRSKKQLKNKKNQEKQAEKETSRADKKRSESKDEAHDNAESANADRKKEVTIDNDKKTKNKKSNSDKDAKDANAVARNQAKGAAYSSVATGLGTVLSGGFKFMATQEQAEQKESEARQKTHENAAQSWSEWMQLNQDMIKNAQSKIEEITRIHFDTLKSASRG